MRSFVNHAARWSWLQSLNSVALLGFWLLTFLEHTPHNMSNKIDRRKSNGAVWKEREKTLKSCNLKTSLCKNEKIGNIKKSDFLDHDLPINFHFNRKSVGSIYRCYRYWTWEKAKSRSNSEAEKRGCWKIEIYWLFVDQAIGTQFTIWFWRKVAV